MVEKEILIDKSDGYYLVAVREKGKLVDFFFDLFGNKNSFYPYSSLLLAKIIRNIGKKGFFIKLPNGGTGFLSTKKSYALGEKVVVNAKTVFDEEKLQRFSDKFLYRTKYFVFKHGKPGLFFSRKIGKDWVNNAPKIEIMSELKSTKQRFSVIVRSKAMELKESNILRCFSEMFTETINVFNDLKSGAQKELVYSSKNYALDMYGDKGHYRITEEQGIFDFMGIWDEINFYSKEKFFFSNDSYLIVQETAALCAIDVNTGNDFSRDTSKINLDACESIAHNIRIKGIGGKIVIDFIPTSKTNRIQIEETLESIFSSDPISTTIYGWTKGNNFEIERKRSKVPLSLFNQ